MDYSTEMGTSPRTRTDRPHSASGAPCLRAGSGVFVISFVLYALYRSVSLMFLREKKSTRRVDPAGTHHLHTITPPFLTAIRPSEPPFGFAARPRTVLSQMPLLLPHLTGGTILSLHLRKLLELISVCSESASTCSPGRLCKAAGSRARAPLLHQGVDAG